MRAGGNEIHIHPWYYYLLLLLFFKNGPLPFWTEALILFFAFVGILLCSYAYAADDSLILYLTLDEDTGDEAKDASNNENHGQKVGNANWAEGKIGGCVDLVAGSYVALLWEFSGIALWFTFLGVAGVLVELILVWRRGQ